MNTTVLITSKQLQKLTLFWAVSGIVVGLLLSMAIVYVSLPTIERRAVVSWVQKTNIEQGSSMYGQCVVINQRPPWDCLHEMRRTYPFTDTTFIERAVARNGIRLVLSP